MAGVVAVTSGKYLTVVFGVLSPVVVASVSYAIAAVSVAVKDVIAVGSTAVAVVVKGYDVVAAGVVAVGSNAVAVVVNGSAVVKDAVAGGIALIVSGVAAVDPAVALPVVTGVAGVVVGVVLRGLCAKSALINLLFPIAPAVCYK